jgi:hypothetical protein
VNGGIAAGNLANRITQSGRMPPVPGAMPVIARPRPGGDPCENLLYEFASCADLFIGLPAITRHKIPPINPNPQDGHGIYTRFQNVRSTKKLAR